MRNLKFLAWISVAILLVFSGLEAVLLDVPIEKNKLISFTGRITKIDCPNARATFELDSSQHTFLSQVPYGAFLGCDKFNQKQELLGIDVSLLAEKYSENTYRIYELSLDGQTQYTYEQAIRVFKGQTGMLFWFGIFILVGVAISMAKRNKAII